MGTISVCCENLKPISLCHLVCVCVCAPHGADAAAHISPYANTSHCIRDPPVAKRYYGCGPFFGYIRTLFMRNNFVTLGEKNSLQSTEHKLYERKDKRCACVHPAYDVHAVGAQQSQMSEQNEYFRILLCFVCFYFMRLHLEFYSKKLMDSTVAFIE